MIASFSLFSSYIQSSQSHTSKNRAEKKGKLSFFTLSLSLSHPSCADINKIIIIKYCKIKKKNFFIPGVFEVVVVFSRFVASVRVSVCLVRVKKKKKKNVGPPNMRSKKKR